MNRYLEHDVLVAQISKNASEAADARQIARRLRTLLPSRLNEIKAHYCRQGSGASKSLRYALADQRYGELVSELVKVSHQALRARISYESHAMLHAARASSRKR
jgi:hypothetical protein